ncbi:MAG: hypothetical protein AAGA48_02220 [Myxococcota bacterium]
MGRTIERRDAQLGHHAGQWWVVGGRSDEGVPLGCVETVTPTGVEPGPTLPQDWHPMAVCEADGSLWALGGTRRPHEPVATVRILDAEAGEWAPGPRLPRPLRSAAVWVLPQGIVVAGGLGLGAAFGPAEWLREAWLLETGDLNARWRPIARLPELRAGGGARLGPPGTAVWVGGRTPEGDADEMLVLDLAADTWHLRPCGPPGLGARGVSTVADGIVVLAGGHRTVPDTSKRRFGPDHHPVIARCHRVDPLTGTAAPLPDLPVPRRAATVVPIGPQAVLVLGGEVNGARPGQFTPVAQVDRIDLEAWTVTEEPPLVEPRVAPLVDVRDGQVLVVGGGSGRVEARRIVS